MAEGNTVLLSVKVSSGNRFDIDADLTKTVAEIKEVTAAKCNIPAAQQRLIYRGRILKDDQTLSSYGISGGHTLHLVQSAAGQQQAAPKSEAATATTAAPQQTTTTAPGTTAGGTSQMPDLMSLMGQFAQNMNQGGGAAAAAGLGSGFPGLPGDMNPGVFSHLLQNPAMQSMMRDVMADPQLLQSIVGNNPFVSQMMRNPMLQQVLQNPDTLRAMLSPEVLQQATNVQNSLHQNRAPAGADTGAAAAGATAPAAPGTAGPTGMPDFSSMLGNLNFESMFQRVQQDPALMQQMQNLAGVMQQSFGLGGAGAPMPGGAAAPNVATGNPAELYSGQLKTLEEMGFIDKDANLMALQRTQGDVNAAIAWLLESGYGG